MRYLQARPAGFEPGTGGLEERGGMFAEVNRVYCRITVLQRLAMKLAYTPRGRMTVYYKRARHADRLC